MSSWLLAIETSGKFGSVAIVDRNSPGASLTCVDLPRTVGSAQSLAPAIDSLLKSAAIKPTDLGAIGLVSGPGSFTGLRVGVATAKALAYALSIPCIEIDTLEVVFWSLQQRTDVLQGEIHCIMDAYRGQLFIKTFASRGTCSETMTIDLDEYCRSILAPNHECRKTMIVGPGSARLRKFLATHSLTIPTEVEIREDLEPHAIGVADLAIKKWEKSQTIDPFSLLPKYFRGSAAEEKAKKV